MVSTSCGFFGRNLQPDGVDPGRFDDVVTGFSGTISPGNVMGIVGDSPRFNKISLKHAETRNQALLIGG